MTAMAAGAGTNPTIRGVRVAYLSIQNRLFDRTITLRQSYTLLLEFIAQYHVRGESLTGIVLSDVGLYPDGTTCDPAQIYDYLRVAGQVLGDDQLRAAADAVGPSSGNAVRRTRA
jgi:hypothetical protein